MDLPSVAQRLTPEIQFLYGRRRGKERLGLDSTRRLLRELGSPERDIPVVHVAGTNGKGSTTAFAAALLQSAGLRVGRFTSPHMIGVEERISIDAVPYDFDALCARVRDMRAAIERADASFFESITALAACAFRDAGVDVAVYEVGLGGRLDSTTALPAQACILTNVGHDHEAILGRGLRAVCAEKLGIARRGVPFFTGLRRAELLRLARTHTTRIGAPLHVQSRDAVRVLELGLGTGMRFEMQHDGAKVPLWTRFMGLHQARNAALAAQAVGDVLHRLFPARRWNLDAGIAAAFMPGRFQVLPEQGDEPALVLDVAHNPEALRATLDLALGVYGSRRPTIVLGMLRDKRFDRVVPRLARLAGRIVLTAPRVARAWEPQHVAMCLRPQLPHVPIAVVPNAEQALAEVCKARQPGLVLGSNYLIGELLPGLARRRGISTEALVTGSGGDHALPMAG